MIYKNIHFNQSYRGVEHFFFTNLHVPLLNIGLPQPSSTILYPGPHGPNPRGVRLDKRWIDR